MYPFSSFQYIYEEGYINVCALASLLFYVLTKKCVRMIRKYHTHKLQTNPRHREKSHRTISITRHQEVNQSKATSFLFPIKMIAKLERTQSDAQQNKERTQNPTMGVTINNNRSTALERTAA